MSASDPSVGLIKVQDPITRSLWKKLRLDNTPILKPELVLQRVIALGYNDLQDYMDDVTAHSDPWNYFARNENPELIKAAAHGFNEVVMGIGNGIATPPATASAQSSATTSGQSASKNSTSMRPTITDPYSGLTPDQAKALRVMEEKLQDVNGQDAYSVTAMALGTLRKSEYLLLPDDMRTERWPTNPAMVGAPWDPVTSVVKFRDFVQIYALNKEAGKESKDPVFFGLLRAEAVKMGWYQGQKEVMFVPAKPDAITTYLADMQAIEDLLEAARSTAFLVPFMAEYVFRTTGHHYLTGLADEYERKYMSMCSACLVPNMVKYLRASELWHWSMHWVSPRVAREALVAINDSERLPHAIALRADAAPAGTAIVTTTAAVIAAMESCNWAQDVEKEGGFNFKVIKEVTNEVKAHVTTYHAAYFAYGVAPPTKQEKDRLAEAVAEAQKFAPVAQGFIDAMYADSSLARAKALKKHADASPVLQRRALRVFRSLAKADTEEIADIFRSTSGEKKTAKANAPAVATGKS